MPFETWIRHEHMMPSTFVATPGQSHWVLISSAYHKFNSVTWLPATKYSIHFRNRNERIKPKNTGHRQSQPGGREKSENELL